MMEEIDPTPFSLFGSIKSALTRLGQKFGYVKKSQQGQEVAGTDPGSSPGSGFEQGFAFQCMAADDKPILVNGEPVMVVAPGDCHQYYLQDLDPTLGWSEPGGYPAPIVEPPPSVFLEAAKMRFRSDDQDLDDRVIRQLWEDNKELREEVTQLRKNTGDDADEAMAAILRDRINDLLTANADLEREVARLRYADAARGAAESVETLDKLRQTRDTLNDILTENDQLKIEVAKARYGEPPLVEQTSNEVDPEQLLVVDLQREQLVKENQELKEQLQEMMKNSGSASSLIFDKFKSAIKLFEDIESGLLTNTKRMDNLQTPWPSKRHEELKTDDDEGRRSDDEELKTDDDQGRRS